jgi:hypothetical protein
MIEWHTIGTYLSIALLFGALAWYYYHLHRAAQGKEDIEKI